MLEPVFAECAGAPRDLGLDQGRALRDEIRADLRAIGCAADAPTIWQRLSASPGRDARLLRDFARHFPQLDERMTGLADGVGCARAAVASLTTREFAGPLATIVRVDASGPALELQWLEGLPPTGLAVRSTRPDGGYANLTLTRPGVVFAVAGVNEHGLAGVAQLSRAASAADRCHAPAVLLLEQCIERLDGVEKALEWCERRPGGGVATLLFADASGAIGGIETDGEKRTRIAAPSEWSARCAGPRARVEPKSRAIDVSGGGLATRRFTLELRG